MSIVAGHPLTTTKRFRLRGYLLAVGASIICSTLVSFLPGPAGLLLSLAPMLAISLWLISQFVGLAVNIIRRRANFIAQRLALIMVELPLIFFGLQSGDYLHLALLYPYYQYEISSTSTRPVRFYWGDQAISVLDGIRIRTLLYDETGKVAATAPLVDEGMCVIEHPLIGNFFIEYVISILNVTRCGTLLY